MPRLLRRPLLGLVAGLLRMDLTEAADPITTHGSIGVLFTRALKPGARAWPESDDAAGSPVDGIVGQSGRIAEGWMAQAKGRRYTAAELLDDDALGDRFAGGAYATIYLSPRHYHRIHAPVTGVIRRALHVPGRLLPVNPPAVRLVDRLFPRNERLVCVLEDTPLGAVAVVAVGAFNVGRITAAFDETLVTNRWRARPARPETRIYHPPVPVSRSDELMTFHLGSTVVVLFEAAARLTVPEPGSPVLLGEVVARRGR